MITKDEKTGFYDLRFCNINDLEDFDSIREELHIIVQESIEKMGLIMDNHDNKKPFSQKNSGK